MIIHKIRLTNFGIYGGTHEFDLAPASLDNFARPIILFRGKNGVGKTTIVEAMRLCLHGALVLGSRVSQQAFDEYLVQRIHHGLNGAAQANEMSVETQFDYVEQGRRNVYRVVRSWRKLGDKLRSDGITIWKDGELVELSGDDQKEHLLREMIPPGVLDVFFFDGEKLETLAEETEGHGLLLSDTVNGLLGLDIVEQLGKDIDVYIARQEFGNGATPLQVELDAILTKEEVLDRTCREIQIRRHELTAENLGIEAAILVQEQSIATQGGDFAIRHDELLARKRNLEAEIGHARRTAQELCGGLMPFAIVPTILQAVSARLELERSIEQNRAAQAVLASRLDRLEELIRSDEYWGGTEAAGDARLRVSVFERIRQDLLQEDPSEAMPSGELILEVTDKDRGILQEWISRAIDEVPRQFSEAIQNLSIFERQLQEVTDQLRLVPPETSIAPLLEELGELHRQRALLQTELSRLNEQEQAMRYQLEEMAGRKRRIHEEIRTQESNTGRVHLALKTQALLDAYKKRISHVRIDQLEKALLKRFNLLCRKTMLLDDLKISPDNLQVTLFHQGKTFSRRQLSAGENQLFAIATLWALREISGRPMPVIIDTPLSRLDTAHRDTMVQEFFPHTSHQVIILATDTEIDDKLYDRLKPAISLVHNMQYDPHTGSMRCQTERLGVAQPSLDFSVRA